MSLPQFGESGSTKRNTGSTAHTIDTREQEAPIVVYLDEIHTPEYEINPMAVEEEKNPTQETG
jgi:hypothetical protein